jgi:hypothetical protein
MILCPICGGLPDIDAPVGLASFCGCGTYCVSLRRPDLSFWFTLHGWEDELRMGPGGLVLQTGEGDTTLFVPWDKDTFDRLVAEAMVEMVVDT